MLDTKGLNCIARCDHVKPDDMQWEAHWLSFLWMATAAASLYYEQQGSGKFRDYRPDLLLGIASHLRVSQQPMIYGFLWLTSLFFFKSTASPLRLIYISSAVV
jgi:hypothetical protein